jgi:uncharacterized membrane protein YidH (DUF202 family)
MVDDKIGMIIGGVIAILILVVGVLYYLMPALDELVEPQMEGKWKVSYENTKSTITLAVAIVIIGILLVAILYLRGKI